MRVKEAILSVAVVLLASPLAAQVEVKVGGYAQTQFNTTSIDADDLVGDEIASSTFETRRIRPSVSVTIDEWITGTLVPDFAAGRVSLKDAFMNFAIDDGFQLRVGQFKKPFSLLELTSSSKILPIEREARIRGLADALALDQRRLERQVEFDGELVLGEEQTILDAFGYKGRDLGMAAHGALGRVSYEVGVFNGAGADRRDDNDGKSFAGRLQLQPSGSLPLNVGGGVSYRELGEDDEDISGAAFELSGEWGDFRRGGVHLIAEAVTGESLATADESFLGGQVWLAYFYPREGQRVEGVEPVLRASFGDPGRDRDDDQGWLFTPGLNLYFHGRNRVMLNWDMFAPGGDFEGASALRAQAQLYF